MSGRIWHTGPKAHGIWINLPWKILFLHIIFNHFLFFYIFTCGVFSVASQILQQNAAQPLRVSSPGGPTIIRALPTGAVQGGVAGSAAAAAAGKQIITVKAGQGVTQPQIVTLVKTTQGMQVAQVCQFRQYSLHISIILLKCILRGHFSDIQVSKQVKQPSMSQSIINSSSIQVVSRLQVH